MKGRARVVLSIPLLLLALPYLPPKKAIPFTETTKSSGPSLTPQPRLPPSFLNQETPGPSPPHSSPGSSSIGALRQAHR